MSLAVVSYYLWMSFLEITLWILCYIHIMLSTEYYFHGYMSTIISIDSIQPKTGLLGAT
jgi:hypothetical protein